jgi:transcriptional regulator with XRE-family HTH domain
MGRQSLSQLGLAIRLGWSQPYLSRRLTGKQPWSTSDLELIAWELGIPVADLTSPRAAS